MLFLELLAYVETTVDMFRSVETCYSMPHRDGIKRLRALTSRSILHVKACGAHQWFIGIRTKCTKYAELCWKKIRNAAGLPFVDYESQSESVHAISASCARSHSDYTINQRITISTVGRPPPVRRRKVGHTS